MTESRDSDDRIAAFLQTSQPELSGRALDAVRQEIHRTRQLVVIGPLREPTSFLHARYGLAAAVVLAVGVLLLSLRPVGGPGGVVTAPPSATPRPSPSVLATGPSQFTSVAYGYTITVPAGWVSAPALLHWDGLNQPGPDADTDRFGGPAKLTAWAFGGPFSGDLAALAADRIAANARDHADTCPLAEPEINEPIDFAGGPGMLIGWNCGGLINQAIALRNGVAYVFTFRDLGIRAAADPTDRALFQSILDSVELAQ